MNREEHVAYLVFGSYFAAIFSSFFLVFRSILSGVDPKRLLHGRPFLFLRTALGALLCTGYCVSSFQCFSLRLTIVTSLVQFHQCQLPFCGVPQRADRTTQWSYTRYAYLHTSTTLGQWLSETQLFEQAWSIVCTGPSNWWWSSFICTWTVIFTAVVWAESTSFPSTPRHC